MRSEPFRLEAADGVRLHVERWLPQGAPRAWIQIVHGMGEHARRYQRFALAACAAGFGVVAHDQRGHGRSALEGRLGDMGPGGWRAAVGDVRALGDALQASAPGAPRVLLGHSMGGFVARAALLADPGSISGCAISGPSWATRLQVRSGALLAALEERRLGPGARSPLLRWLLFGRAERAFRPSRTRFDWLSRDPSVVDAYLADPHCGFVLASRSLREMLAHLSELPRLEARARLPPDLPVCVLAGSDDPLGGRRAVEDLAGRYHRAGLERVSIRIYPGARHEPLNELNYKEVESDLLGWITTATARRGR